ncbi:hypothetical protein HD806DRAFT_37934 [Xylariaceae sp. AK1471]|nr:hypothetical protein HD806DRAFT_37934 [Xylariaceae sp. AK1471]
MCFLPCWPVRDIVLEDAPEVPTFQYVWNGTKWIPTISDGAQPGMATAPMPMMPQGYRPMPGSTINVQPGTMPPMACAAPAPNGPAYLATGYGQPTPPITPPGAAFAAGGNSGIEMGKTRTEIEAENQANAVDNQLNEPQDFKPADDDPSRMYWSRELDGHWTTRNRFSLDQMGNFRWYVTENGVFYAKMLPE